MALFIAQMIIRGTFDYATFFSYPLWRHHQDDVDAILEAEGRGDLIVRD